MQQWLKDIKIGDTVIVNGFHASIGVIGRLTATQIILRKTCKKFRRSDGYAVGGFSSEFLREPAPEIIERIEKDEAIKTISYEDWSNCSTESLKNALNILENG